MKFTIISMSLLLTTVVAFAGGGHFHPKKVAKCAKECSVEQIKAAIPEAISYLSKWDKIESSWASAKVDKVEKKEFKKGPEWVATLVDSEKQKRYVFFSLDGFVAGSNSTGE